MLESFSVHHFKSLRDVTLKLADVTMLVGWNASGKSNVLEALELLCWTARAPRLSDLTHAIELGQVRIRGNLSDLAPTGGDVEPITLSCTIAAEQSADDPLEAKRVGGHRLGPLDLEMELEVASSGPVIARERLCAPNIEALNFRAPLYDAHRTSSSHAAVLTVRYQNFRRAKKPSIEAMADQPCFVQLTTPTRFQGEYEESREVIPKACRKIGKVLSNVRFLDPAPRAMRGYAFVDDDQLHLSGDNVSAVLHRIVERGEADQILAFVGDLPEQAVAGIDFLRTPRNEVMVTLKEQFGGIDDAVPAALLSDGTLRVLAIAAALLSAPHGALVVVEEIDNGVHPSRARHLLNHIIKTARARDLRVLITTHNPALQDALPVDVLRNVTLASRDPGTGATVLRRLADMPEFPRIAAAGPLGQLLTDRTFDHLTRPTSEPVSVDLSWLDNTGSEP